MCVPHEAPDVQHSNFTVVCRRLTVRGLIFGRVWKFYGCGVDPKCAGCKNDELLQVLLL
jgi:hypothetical protein